MSELLKQLQSKKDKLKPCMTRITTESGKSWFESRNEKIEECSSLCPGFVVDTKPDLRITEVLPQLFLGSQDVAHDLDILKTNKITHILNVATGVQNIFEGQFVYMTLEALDNPEFQLIGLFDDCIGFIDKVLGARGSVLVHCNAGVSRSASVVIAYLMTKQRMKFHEAFDFVKQKRSFIRPNEGFLLQLRKFEEKLRL